ncbi:MAG TPA: hypothetical protein VD833_15650 [Vicinamibacterales bacterium]|nr:hypothetical protein [Vicinamibacterales bacterium]
MCLVFNANGREIPSFDSQPAKFAAIEFARRGTLRLNHVVGATPLLAERSGFARDREGNYRSAYPAPSSVVAGGLAWLLSAAGLIDLGSPAAPSLVAKLTASALAALAVSLAFVCARARLRRGAALCVAVGFGLGTNMWATVGQTLWQQETALCALMGAVALMSSNLGASLARGVLTGACLGVAGAARPQLAPTIAVMSTALLARYGCRWRALLPAAPVAVAAATAIGLNVHWFGHPLGAVPMLEALHPKVHRVYGSTGGDIWSAALGLLFSPSRGLLVFSPIVLVAIGSVATVRREGWSSDLLWCWMAAAVQFLFYASYTVWWGGHTYGPRYALDLLPALVPLGAAGLAVVPARPVLRIALAAALGWSIAVAGTGAFVYPAERWNTEPASVDFHHERLWDWSDSQIRRAWQTGPSPQNFSLFGDRN